MTEQQPCVRTGEQQQQQPCESVDCPDPARMAMTSGRGPDRALWTKVWWDERQAPKRATRFCKAHGRHFLGELAGNLVDGS